MFKSLGMKESGTSLVPVVFKFTNRIHVDNINVHVIPLIFWVLFSITLSCSIFRLSGRS